ncbi:ATP synthase subunit F [Erysipelotrichaceae bacterium OH741_COT-311]|nr:V-type ATP synthase subunit F [Erysipelotrichaceae bacterium]MDO5085044.1 V-type ATP synthase subunit F [Erysipelotrichaceae bacterium]RRC91527.1 ATP synthase subunit F [Erysipelotrichaceae bacterium OH741_COT-311]
MKMTLISDNIDTQIGLRLAGVEGVVVHSKTEVLQELEKAIANEEIAIVLMTTKIVNLCPDVISEMKLTLSKPLLVEIPDRHGSAKIGETIDSYISQAIGIKLGGL